MNSRILEFRATGSNEKREHDKDEASSATVLAPRGCINA